MPNKTNKCKRFLQPSLFLTAFVTTISFLQVGFLHAQCSNQSKLNTKICSIKECQLRQGLVHKTCDVRGGRSCKYGRLDKDEIERRRGFNNKCLDARLAVQECYLEPDEGHLAAITDAIIAISDCDLKKK